ncbi:hypothetical protein SELMODRAFT_92651 [Selaginella moellendorffii]|uniref:PHD finger protein ING n=1 Tax=Selaginella moellendorffii TaxID=88036 RepID=D8REZ2_SELML|nr:PHD finger protein ING2 [Selaginella moellendorffii]XP_002981376.1 PHD finger protein ING2 [Selaginella moellendorffii]XP_024542163.1 PHD finger protein ING2 [Selaginella moellendorffii]EFJ17564.1 hypothetical protein SELMODRAFT_154381 [Selaginella moellendorffii]EFJ29023.1 hypothetical protein SELMODRAFT_92651 [Selaginella moellendorffii]|eukprot:XP_002969899.1 PHD finger protein ING2 [Selaginella moellendorffii]
MAIARTGVFVDDYLEYSSSLHAEVQRHLSTMTELDVRAHNMMLQTREDTKTCLFLPTQQIKKPSPEQEEFERLKKEIEANHDNIRSLCTEKVLLAQQAYDLIDSQMKRLDEDLNQFAEDLKLEGKISPDEPAILPMLPLRDEKRKSSFFVPPGKRLELKDWERDRDTELMPPPGNYRKRSLPAPDLDQPVDPNEETYCICGQVSFGDMIACDNENCTGGEWFHYQCVGLSSETRFKAKWYCPTCTKLQRRGLLDPLA